MALNVALSRESCTSLFGGEWSLSFETFLKVISGFGVETGN